MNYLHEVNEEKIEKLNEDIKNLSLQDVQLITLKVVTEKVEKKLADEKDMLEYYNTKAEGTLTELSRNINKLEETINWNENLLRMLSTDSLAYPNELSLSPKAVGEHMNWEVDFKIKKGVA